MGAPIARLKDVVRSYTRGGATVHALAGFTLDLEAGGFYALMGPSGSGKTTLLNLLGGLDSPTTGEVRVGDVDLGTLGSAALARWRADNVGFVFQGFNLLPVLTAFQNVELPLLLAPVTRAQRREKALFALRLVGLEERAHHRPRELSGGQEQRVAIARAIVTDPKVILADEPTGDLDRVTADQVLDLLVRLNREFGKTIIMVTHDPLAAARARTVVHLDKGKLGTIVENSVQNIVEDGEAAARAPAPAAPAGGAGP